MPPKDHLKKKIKNKKKELKNKKIKKLLLLLDNNEVNIDDIFDDYIDKKKEDNEESTKNRNVDIDDFNEQLSLVVIAALGFIVAYAWNYFLNQLIEKHIKNNMIEHFIYVIGITLIAVILIYFISKHIGN